MAYWDTSCLLKLYAPEPDSAVFQAYALRGGTIATSSVTRLELFIALARKEAAGDLRPGGAASAVAAYDADVAAGLIAVEGLGPQVVGQFERLVDQCYRRVPPLTLRTLDAVHLGTAAVLGESEVVATDKRLREAATVRGHVVYPPP